MRILLFLGIFCLLTTVILADGGHDGGHDGDNDGHDGDGGGHNNQCRYNLVYGAFLQDPAYVVAQSQGFFASENVCVTFGQVVGSVQQFQALAQGNYSIISTAFDNVSQRVINSGLTLSTIAGVDKGPNYVLVGNVANGIHSISDLQGKTLAVDAPDSGFVLAAQALLAAHGLLVNRDYTFQIIGGSARVGAMISGTFNGALVYATMFPFPITDNLPPGVTTVLARAIDLPSLNPIQNTVLAINSTFVQHGNNRDAIVAFLRAHIRATMFALDPANSAAVTAALQVAYNITAAKATSEYNTDIVVPNGTNYASRLSRQGMINLINLRQQFLPFTGHFNALSATFPTPGGLVDLRFYREALFSLDYDDSIRIGLEL